MTIQLPIRWSPRALSAGAPHLVACLAFLAACAAILVLAMTPSADAATKHAASHTPHQPTAVAARVVRDKRRLAHEASTLKQCLRANRRHPARCNTQRHEVQRTSEELNRATSHSSTNASPASVTPGAAAESRGAPNGQQPVGTNSEAGAAMGQPQPVGASEPQPVGASPESTGQGGSGTGTSGPTGTGTSGASEPTNGAPSESQPGGAGTEPVGEGSDGTTGAGGTEKTSGSGGGSGTEGSLSSTSFPMGLNSGSEPLDIAGAAKLGAKLVRLAFGIEESVQEMEPEIGAYANKGIRVLPLASFYRSVPTQADAQNLATWAKTFGPGGTFWKGRSEALPIEDIEFGNETDNGYQYGYEVGGSQYTALAEAYADRFKESSEAIAQTGTDVGLLAQEQDPTGHWIADLYAAVPNFAKYVAGWTIHPYGPEWRTSVNDLIKQTTAYGAPSTIPIYMTEWGLSSDNGACLTSNFNWNPCMTYKEAANVLRTAVAEMGQAFGKRIGALMIYQVRDQQLIGSTNNVEAYFGALQHELQPKGEYTTAVQELFSAH